MSTESLEATLIELGLITPEQHEQLEGVLHQFPGYRFEQLAVETGMLTEEQVARAHAHKYNLQFVSDERLGRIRIPDEALMLLPDLLIRDRLMVPSFFDRRRMVLSLIVADPTDVNALRTAQEVTGAERLRLFVAGPSALKGLIERVLPEEQGRDTDPGEGEVIEAEPDSEELRVSAQVTIEPPSPNRAIILDPDLTRLSLLRSIDALEGARSELVAAPNQVAEILETGEFDRIYYRTAISAEIDPWLARWKRIRPDLMVSPLPNYTPATRPAVPVRASRDFLMGLVEFLLLASESKSMDVRARVRRIARMSRHLGVELELSPERRDTLTLGALFLFLDELTVISGFVGDETTDRAAGRRFEMALAVLEPLGCPFDLNGLYAGLESRLIENLRPTDDLLVESLYTIKAWAESGAWDLSKLDRPQHHATVLAALDRALRRERLLGRLSLQSGGSGTSTVILAEREAALVTALEARLARAGFEVLTVADGAEALERAKELRPLAVIANQRLPRRDGLSLLLELKRDPDTLDIPVLLITNRSDARDVARGLELGAEEVLEKPLNLQVLMVRLRRAIARGGRGQQAGVAGRLSDLALPDLIQTLSLSRKTAAVKFTCPGGEGEIFMDAGQLTHAAFGRRRGEPAFYQLAFQEGGAFEVRFDASPPGKPTIEASTDSVLLEAMRLLDEARR